MRRDDDLTHNDGDIADEFWGSSNRWADRTGPLDRTAVDRPDNPVTGAVRAIRDGFDAFRPHTVDHVDLDRTREHGMVRPTQPGRAGSGGRPVRKPVAHNDLSISDLGSGLSASTSLPEIDDWSAIDDLNQRYIEARATGTHLRVNTGSADAQPGRVRRVSPEHGERSPRQRGRADARPMSDDYSGLAFIDEASDYDDPASFTDDARWDHEMDIAETRERGWRGADPLLLKFGVAVLISLALVPFVVRSRGGGNPTAATATTTPAPAQAAPVASTVTTTVPVTTPAASATVPTTSQAPVTMVTAAIVNKPLPTDPPAASSSSSSTTSPPPAPAPSKSSSSSESSETSSNKSSSNKSSDPASSAAPAESSTTTVGARKKLADNPTCTNQYTAVDGDSWYRIAKAVNTTVSKLTAANDADLETVILPGAKVCLPDGAAAPSGSATTVASTATPADSTTSTTTAAENSSTTSTTAAAKTTDAATTTAAPATTQAEATTQSANSPGPNASADEVKQVIRDVFPDELEAKALDIARKESTYRPSAYNGICCYGVFQIHFQAHKSWLKSAFGVSQPSDLYDPLLNTKIALEIYRRAGNSWSPWTTA